MHYSLTEMKKFGYLRIAGATIELNVADVDFNLEQHIAMLELAEQECIDFLIFPDFSLTGITCADLFKQKILLDQVAKALSAIKKNLESKQLNVILTVPQKINHHLCKVLYILSKKHQQGYIMPISKNSPLCGLFSGAEQLSEESIADYPILNESSIFTFAEVQGKQFFQCAFYQNIAELYSHFPQKNMRVDCNIVLSDQPEIAEQAQLIQNQLSAFAALHENSVFYNSPSFGESTTDFVYSGRSYIFEHITCLAKTNLYESDLMIADLDLDKIQNNTALNQNLKKQYHVNLNYDLTYEMNIHNSPETIEDDFDFEIHRPFPKNFFIPTEADAHAEYLESVLNIAAHGLAKRLAHLQHPLIILGLSGGSDSTIALLIALRAQKILNEPSRNILCVSMPGFGTTERTFQNTKNLAEAFQTQYLEIYIHQAVNQHFKDIEQNPDQHDITYENAQARERTQILMDLANQRNGIVLGTGDLSEAALGFATYGGDHLSMYNCNAGIPKTLIRHLIRYEAKRYLHKKPEDTSLAKILFDILDTPVSPELLPPEEGEIAQKTEHIVGPYELHDFFIYQFMKYQYSPKKLLFIAEQTFAEEYDHQTILYWLKMFYKRFFNNQFKRSAAPDSPTITDISFSPRVGLHMPSDAISSLWLKELEEI